MKFKKPVSVLVVIHTPALDILLLERAQHPGFWQSVTGSQEENESLLETACREVQEETGIAASAADFLDWEKTNQFEIFPEWQYRYGPGVTQNTEHVFSLQLASPLEITLAADEHLRYQWLPWQEAAALTLSSTNRDAILQLPKRRMA